MSENSEKNNIVNLEDFEALKKELETLKKTKQNETIEDKPTKAKKERTDKQKESFQKALEARKAKIDERNKQREQLQDQAKKEAEDELIKKAIKYKKQQIKKIQVELPVSDSESDEEEPIEKKPLPKPKLERSTNKQNFPTSKDDLKKIKDFPKSYPPEKEKSKFIFV